MNKGLPNNVCSKNLYEMHKFPQKTKQNFGCRSVGISSYFNGSELLVKGSDQLRQRCEVLPVRKKQQQNNGRRYTQCNDRVGDFYCLIVFYKNCIKHFFNLHSGL